MSAVRAGKEQQEMDSADTRLVWLDQLRAVAMFFVILGHFAISRTGLTLIYAFHMPLFFMVSGMTFHPGRYETIRACAVDKAKKLLIPYFLLSLAMIPLWYLNWKVLKSSPTGLVGLLKGIAVSNEAVFSSPTNATWFLPCLFLVSVLFFAFSKWTKGSRRGLALAVACSGVFGALLSVLLRVDVPWHVPTVFTAVVFYYIGYLFMQHRETVVAWLDERPRSWIPVVVVLAVAGACLALVNGKVSMHANHYNVVPLFYVSALALGFAIVLAVMLLPKVKPLAYVGQNTLIYIAIHAPILRTIQNFSPASGHIAAAYPVPTAAAIFVVVIPISMLVNRLLPFLVAKRYGRGWGWTRA